MKPNEDPTTSEILHRLVVPIQTRGNLGKSTEAIARCEWMSQRGVLWKGYDLDAFNRTLSTTYPENVVFVEPGAEPEGELIKIFRRLAHSEVTVIDPSAHMNRTILRAMEMVRLTELCRAIAARVSVLIYPVDEVSDGRHRADCRSSGGFGRLGDRPQSCKDSDNEVFSGLRTRSPVASLRRRKA